MALNGLLCSLLKVYILILVNYVFKTSDSPVVRSHKVWPRNITFRIYSATPPPPSPAYRAYILYLLLPQAHVPYFYIVATHKLHLGSQLEHKPKYYQLITLLWQKTKRSVIIITRIYTEDTQNIEMKIHYEHWICEQDNKFWDPNMSSTIHSASHKVEISEHFKSHMLQSSKVKVHI